MTDVVRGIFSYDGLVATHHRLPARDLGAALVGLDAIVSSLIKMLETGSIQRKKPRETTLILTVGEPAEGSFELPWIAQIAAGLLPLFPQFAEALRSNLVEHFVNYAMLWFGGRRPEAEAHMDKMLDILAAGQKLSYEDRERERAAVYDDRQQEREHTRALLHGQAVALHGAAKLAVYPVGRSASSFSTGPRQPLGHVLVDEATADAIRAKEELSVSEVMTMDVRIEGIRDARKTMFVYDPEDSAQSRLFPVVIADPAFAHPSNVYKHCYAGGMVIKLTGKMTRYADGLIKTFHAIEATATEQ